MILAAAAVLLLNALTGTSSSPLPRLLHIAHVPGWWPLVLAVVTGVVLGGFINRNRSGGPGGKDVPGAGQRAAPATRGRHAVPRRIRRTRQREARRQERIERGQAALRARAEAAARAEEAASAPPPPRGALGRVRALLRRGSGAR